MTQPFYIAILVYESHSSAPTYPPLYEEEIVLLQADSDEEARTKALDYAQKQETSFQNELGETITHTFRHLVDVQQALYSRFGDGTPLYSRHFRNIDAYQTFEPMLSGEEL